MPRPYFWKSKQAWYVNVTLPDGRKSKKKLHEDQDQAMRLWAKMLANEKHDIEDPSFESISLLWLAAQELRLDRGDVSAVWVSRVLGTIQRFNSRYPVRCSEVDHDFLDDLAASMSANYARTELQVLMQILRWAKKKGKIHKDPAEGWQLPSAQSRNRILSLSEHSTLCRNASRPLKMLLRFAWLTGARPGELRGLKWDMITNDMSRAVIRNHKTSRKTKKPRVVYFPPLGQALLKKIRREQDSDFVFLNSRRQPWKKNALVLAVRRLRDKSGVDAVAYNYRHTWITRALLSGVDIATVAVLSGHSDIAMISRVYGHLDQHSDHLSKAAKKVK